VTEQIPDRWSSLAHLAHDLREPLATILMWEQILRLTDDPLLRAKALDAIRESAREQTALLDQLTTKG